MKPGPCCNGCAAKARANFRGLGLIVDAPTIPIEQCQKTTQRALGAGAIAGALAGLLVGALVGVYVVGRA